MTTIHPCPFCGHDDVEISDVYPNSFSVVCPECECNGPIFPQVMDAIRAWNGSVDRTPPAGNVIPFDFTLEAAS